MADLNACAIVGRFTEDPEIRYFENGTNKAEFSVAVSNSGKDAGTSFFSCEMWGKRAETLAEHLKKGDWVALSGRMEQQHWEKDGEKKSRWVFRASDFNFVGKKA